MSSLDLAEFNAFLESVIEGSSQDGFSTDRIVATILSGHPERLDKIQHHLNVIGLRTLIRNSCRTKRTAGNNGPDLFGDFHVRRRVVVPYHDKGKLRFTRKRPDELTVTDLDAIVEYLTARSSRPSKALQSYTALSERIKNYRSMTPNVAEALEIAQREGAAA